MKQRLFFMLPPLIAGSLLPLAFAPVSWPWLAPLSLAVLYHLLRGCKPRRAAWCGWLFGFGMMGVGVSWVQVSIHQFGLPVYAFSVSVTVFAVMFMACLPALATSLAAALPQRNRWVGTAVFAACWTLVEWFRGWVLTGFPWLYAGYSQIDSPLAGFAPIGGVLLVSLVVAWCGALLAEGIRGPGLPVRAAVTAVLGIIVVAGAVLQSRSWSQPTGPALQAVLIQGNIEQTRKWNPDSREPTMALYRDLSMPQLGADLIIWPETAVPAFPQQITGYLDGLQSAAQAAGTTLILGIPTFHGGRDLRNSVVALGATTGGYDKRHLVPFGEYLPWRSVLGSVMELLSLQMPDFTAGGSAQPPIMVAGHALGISICYEDAFGMEVRAGLPAAGLLVNVSNDAWFGDSLAPHQHLDMARMRAVEFSRYMLRATNTGVSAIINTRGKVVATIRQFEAGTVRAEVIPQAGSTPYTRFGDAPLIVLLAAGLLGAWRAAKTRKQAVERLLS